MSHSNLSNGQLIAKIELLEREIAELKLNRQTFNDGETVKVPEQFKPIFDVAQATVKEYFKDLKLIPSKGTIEINEQRYVLVRASALSYEFFNNIKLMYSDRGEEEAFNIGKNFLFDVGHVLGIEDAKRFHKKMNLKDPIEKLSAGPVHFAYSGWASVNILPESSPSPDDNFYLKYEHPYSFEADSWIKSGKKSSHPVCVMNSAYSSGWCTQSFGIPLTAVEISCKAKGDDSCTFIMAPPHKIQKYLEKEIPISDVKNKISIPFFLERKKVQEQLETSLKDKTLLLKEIHHRVKNNLQVITSLLSLQSSFIEDEKTKELFSYSQYRINAMAVIHEMLYQTENISKINYGDYVRNLISGLIRSMKGENNKINLKINVEKINLNIDTAIPLGLLINEIVTNSLKYGFVGDTEREIYIELKEDKHQHFTLNIGDNGIGFSDDINFTTSNSLGLILINDLALQLNGSAEKDKSKKGTHYIIHFEEIGNS